MYARTLVKLSSLISLFSVLAASCNRIEELDVRSTEYITFTYSEDALSASGSVETKAMDNELTCDITDWEYVEGETETKAKLTETLSGNAGVFGYNFTEWGSSVKPTVMYNLKSTFENGGLTPESKVLWKKYDSGSLRFYAYAPYGKFTLSTKDTGGAPYLSYTVPATNKDQIDILYAKSEDISFDKREAVPLQFRHAMTAVQFRLGIDGATLKSVTVSGVNNTGTLSLDGTWSGQSGSGSYSVTNVDSLLIMVPQTVPSGATISLTYNDGAAEDKIISASIADQDWPVGKKVTYTLKKQKTDVDKDEYIYFDLYVSDVIITATQYSGGIIVNGAEKTVSGEHKTTNKYYIYHSASDTYTGTNESIKWKNTGYASTEDFTNKKKCRVPQYTEMTVGGKTWGEYITNNTNPADVLNAWKRVEGTNTEENVFTFNRILITGDSTFDVTIDRVYSRYFPYLKVGDEKTFQRITTTSESKEKYGGITIGAPNLETYSDDWSRTYKEKVTLRLKGNNYFSRISYSKPVNSSADGYLHITSEKGDGIAEGTLTVTLPQLRQAYQTNYWNFSRCALIGGGNPGGGDNSKRQVSGLEFNGGIVYVGLEEINGSKWVDNYNLMTCIGAVNSSAKITINGGILTSVAYGPGSAIGGGAGWQDVGGNGDVTINGGNVYAYCFGVLNTKSSFPVKGTAIGGGSSAQKVGKNGTVTIKGGNVYAYSTGGAAVGGGASSLIDGGDAIITVNGGNLYANSISGSIGGYSVDAGTAIGGGGAGITSGNGGLASMTITEGKIIAGSVGGGSCANSTGRIGRAEISVSGGETSAQFLLVKDKTVSTANTFTMRKGVIKNSNTSDTGNKKIRLYGGAVYMESGTCSIQGGTIEKCSAELGGAVYMRGGEFTMSGGAITNCSSATDGGAVYIDGGEFTMSGGEIKKNVAKKGNGGGVYVSGGNFTMPKNSTGKIWYNSADSDLTEKTGGNGGGIYVRSEDKNVAVSVIAGQVTYNAADSNGGGLCVDMDGSDHSASITIGKEGGKAGSPYIASNSAAMSGGGMAVQGSGSNITINSGTVKGNVSAFVKNEDIRNDGGTVNLVGKGAEVDVNYKTITFYANNGADPEPFLEQRVITSTNSPLKPAQAVVQFKKEFYHMTSWSTKRDGSGTNYPVDGGGVTMNISDNVSLYAQWEENK